MAGIRRINVDEVKEYIFLFKPLSMEVGGGFYYLPIVQFIFLDSYQIIPYINNINISTPLGMVVERITEHYRIFLPLVISPKVRSKV